MLGNRGFPEAWSRLCVCQASFLMTFAMGGVPHAGPRHPSIHLHAQWPSCARLFWDSMDCSLLVFSVHGIFQARMLEWVVISYSRGSFRPRDQSGISWTGKQIPYRGTNWKVKVHSPKSTWIFFSPATLFTFDFFIFLKKTIFSVFLLVGQAWLHWNNSFSLCTFINTKSKLCSAHHRTGW